MLYIRMSFCVVFSADGLKFRDCTREANTGIRESDSIRVFMAYRKSIKRRFDHFKRAERAREFIALFGSALPIMKRLGLLR